MARPPRSYCTQGRAAALVWTASALLFYLAFRSAMDHSPITSSDPESPADRRARLYDKMSRDLDEHGAAFLKGGETSQLLSLSDLFDLSGGSVSSKLKAADPPVRANVLYLSPQFSEPIS